ncbi:hypothetical protein ST47_g2084 [Ascochyta rabiei]|uniref:Uncharacterized protein n=1 Tax=Didymella rabiei TaxID=5454 RepID=A0A163K533_DIDRA|nr:hypothetical protein ST47_g2084 [Ascochyta rabiei]
MLILESSETHERCLALAIFMSGIPIGPAPNPTFTVTLYRLRRIVRIIGAFFVGVFLIFLCNITLYKITLEENIQSCSDLLRLEFSQNTEWKRLISCEHHPKSMANGEISLAGAALAVALTALAIAVGQLLQQVFSTAEGYRRCQHSVLGPWARKTRLTWRRSQFRFEVKFTTPDIILQTNVPMPVSRKMLPRLPVKREVVAVDHSGANATSIPVEGREETSTDQVGVGSTETSHSGSIAHPSKILSDPSLAMIRGSLESIGVSEEIIESITSKDGNFELMCDLRSMFCPFLPLRGSSVTTMSNVLCTDVETFATHWARILLRRHLEQYILQEFQSTHLKSLLGHLVTYAARWPHFFYESLHFQMSQQSRCPADLIEFAHDVFDETTAYFVDVRKRCGIEYKDLVLAHLHLGAAAWTKSKPPPY